MKNDTFAISNFGVVGLDYATPIINSPESAILGVGALKTIALFVERNILPKSAMPFSITCDHRIIDREMLEDS